jgi:hypothetical protein
MPIVHTPLSAILLATATPTGRAGWSFAHRETLSQYLGIVAHWGPFENPELFPSVDYTLAYLVNAHVAWSIALNLDPAYASLSVEELRRVPLRVGRRTLSLDDIVGQIWLRSPLEPRLRLLLNPGWKGAPPLPEAAFEGHSFAWQLRSQSERCGAMPGFWAFDAGRHEIRVNAFANSAWGLPDEPAPRVHRLMELVPPPANLRATFVGACGSGLQRCSVAWVPFDQERMWGQPPKIRLSAAVPPSRS